MTDEDFLARWLPIAKRLDALEETYLVERVRKNGHPQPQGEALAILTQDLDAVCDLCIQATPAQRARMFDLFSRSWLLPPHLQTRIGLPEKRPPQDGIEHSLRRALAAATLVFNAEVLRSKSELMGHGDTFLPLGHIWVTAHQRGLDPEPHFRAAAAWSPDEGHSAGVRRLFLRFHETAFFRADVAPRLSASA